MGYYMGIDIGTSSVKTLVMKEDGTVACIAQKGYEIRKAKLEYAEQNMEVLWEAVKYTIRSVLAEHAYIKEQIRAVSYSGQMHGLVMLDQKGCLVRDAIIWADQRSREQIRNLHQIISKKEYQSVTYNAVSTGFLISSLLWVKEEEPQLYEQAASVMLPKDYIRFRMCGELGTDMSDASSSAVFDTAGRNWAYSFIDRLGLKRSLFVPCHESYEEAGSVTAACEKETGLRQGTKVIYGGGDALMQAVGNGMIGQEAFAANIGTASQIACTVHRPLCDTEYRTNTFCHVREDLWMIAGANLSGGVALKWLMEEILHAPSFEQMTKAAAQAPAGSEGLLFLPYLSGERCPYNDPEAKGIYHGLTLKHQQPHLIRSTMEGIVFNLRQSQEIMRDMGITASKIIASGGGARGELFRQIQADVFGKEIYTSQIKEQACVGAAITAAVGMKTYRSYEEACEKIARLSSQVTQPDPGRQKIYEEQYQHYKELYPKNKDLFQEK